MYQFLPFLVGPRMCLGYKFALLEMKAILACLLRELTFDRVPGTCACLADAIQALFCHVIHLLILNAAESYSRYS